MGVTRRKFLGWVGAAAGTTAIMDKSATASEYHHSQRFVGVMEPLRQAGIDLGIETLEVGDITDDNLAVFELILPEGPPIGPLHKSPANLWKLYQT